MDDLNTATIERIKVQEEKLIKKDLEFSGDIKDIKTKQERENGKVVNQLTALQTSFDKEQKNSPEGTISESIIEIMS
jgi:hypothetical protein